MKSLIAWFANNSVAGNLLLLLVIVAGVINFTSRLPKEVYPEYPANLISVTVPYLGAAPEEVEEAVCARIEDRVQGLESVKRVRSYASEGFGRVTLEIVDDVDLREALDDIKTRIDAIDSFPAETEKPIIKEEIVLRRQVLTVVVSGDADERTLRGIGERVRDEISALQGVTQVELAAVRSFEVSIEVSELTLRRHGLTFDTVVAAIRRSSLDLPGGSVTTKGGEILLRTDGQAYRGHEFESIPIINRPDGTRLTLGQVATIVDGFEETLKAARFDGLPAVLVHVYRVGSQDVVQVAESVRTYLELSKKRLPEGIELAIWQDDSRLLKGRMDTLYKNGLAGLILVILVLTLFLRPRLAFWVSAGILISFMGAFSLMPLLDLSINQVSLFAFMVVLGIVVDDAIVVSENIYRHHQMGKSGLKAAVDGAQEVAVPVTFSMLTTLAAFGPLLLVGGNTAKIMRNIPLVVISVLVFSLFEALFVLPAHLKRNDRRLLSATQTIFDRLQRPMGALLDLLIRRTYRSTLRMALKSRLTVVAIAVSLLLLTVGLVAGRRINFTFFPPVEAENIVAFLALPQGTPIEVTARSLKHIEASFIELQKEIEAAGEPDAFKHVLTTVGEQPFRSRQSRFSSEAAPAGSHLGEVNIELAPAEGRFVSASDLTRRWRELTGPIPDAVALVFVSDLLSTGAAVNIQLAGPDLHDLESAATDLKLALSQYKGVEDVSDSFRPGKRMVKLDISPQAETLGISLSDLARQVRQAFYGEEAQRIQRGQDEVKIMVRYPSNERRSLANLEGMRIRTPEGDEVPFSSVGKIEIGRSYSTIVRTDRKRTVDVTANIDHSVANANAIIASVQLELLPRLVADYQGLTYTLEGEQKEQRQTLADIGQSLSLALFLIYALLAIPFRSYIQPFIVMSAIPFGVVGAVGGHFLMGRDLTVLSVFGIVALTGIVVNDSLVLVDFINRDYRAGTPLAEAIRRAGEERFRPIILTSLTTFAGLAPLLLERSLQAQFLIPIAISLAFGVLFSTVIILVFVPISYSLLMDLERQVRRFVSNEE